MVFEKVEDLKAFLSEKRTSEPIAGAYLAHLEVVRYLGLSEQECAVAEHAVRAIAALSVRSANDWVENGILSAHARRRASLALERYICGLQEPEAEPPHLTSRDLWVTERFNSTFGLILDQASIDRTVVRLGAVDPDLQWPISLLVHASDLAGLGADPDAQATVRRLALIGTRLILIWKGPLSDAEGRAAHRVVDHILHLDSGDKSHSQVQALRKLLSEYCYPKANFKRASPAIPSN